MRSARQRVVFVGTQAVPDGAGAFVDPPRPPPYSLPRRTLWTLLDRASQRHVVTLVAPPGSGKTTLLSQWYQRPCAPRRAWLSIDPRIEATSAFLSALAAALRKGAALDIETPSDARTFVAALRAALGDERLFIVLDDVHGLARPFLAMELEYLLKYTPDSICWLLSGRWLPEINLTELQLCARHSAFDATHLDLQPAHIERLGQRLTPTFTAEDAQRLFAQTEGWLAGVRLALTTREIEFETALDTYFGALLRELDTELRNFLLTVAVVDCLDSDLCDALLDAPATHLVAHAERMQLFFRRTGATRFRIHPLFQAFLRRTLRRERPEQVPVLQRRASQWFLQAQRFEEAVAHALATEQRAWFLEVLARAARAWVKSGAIAQALAWTERLSIAELRTHEQLWTAHATCLILSRRFAQAAALLDEISDSGSGKLRTLKAMLGLLSNRASDTALATQCWDTSEGGASELTGTLMSLQAYWLMKQQRFEAAQRRATQARDCLRKQGCHYGATHANAVLCAALGALGRNQAVLQHAENGFALYAHRPRDFVWANAAITLAHVRYEQNRLAEARELCQNALPLLSASSSLEVFSMAHVVLARIHAAEGRWREAEVLLDDLHGYLETGYCPLGLAQVCFEKTRLYQQLGRYADIETLAREFDLDGREARGEWHGPAPTTTTDEAAAIARLGCAQALRLWYRNDQQRCAGLLDQLHAQALAIGYTQRALTLAAWRAVLKARQNDMAAAFALLNEVVAAIQAAQGTGFLRSVYDEVPDLQELLDAATNANALRGPFIKVHHTLGRRPTSPRSGAARMLPELLTERELAVLRLLAQGLSNQQICQRSNIAITTAKWHLKNIFAKLEVGTRTAALARARALGLIE